MPASNTEEFLEPMGESSPSTDPLGQFIRFTLEKGSMLTRMFPALQPERQGVEITRDIPYRDSGLEAHLLDVYRPKDQKGKLPALLYIHGGGFTILSKDTHWMMAGNYAKKGMVVFNINYRLSPEHPFPGPLEDCAYALQWVIDNAEKFGADLDRLVIAGESAGGNLSLALTLGLALKHDHFPWMKKLHDSGVKVKAAIPACGILETTNPGRFKTMPGVSNIALPRIMGVCTKYLPSYLHDKKGSELASPLTMLERLKKKPKDFPSMFVFAGLADPIFDDTRRLAAALQRLGSHHHTHFYPRAGHAFHAATFTKSGKQSWEDQYRYLEEVVL